MLLLHIRSLFERVRRYTRCPCNTCRCGDHRPTIGETDETATALRVRNKASAALTGGAEGTAAEVVVGHSRAIAVTGDTSAVVVTRGTSAIVVTADTRAVVVRSGTSAVVVKGGTGAGVVACGTSAGVAGNASASTTISSTCVRFC